MKDHRFHVLSCPGPLFILGCMMFCSALGVTLGIGAYHFVVMTSRETLHCEQERNDSLIRVRDLQDRMNEVGLLYVAEQRKKRCQTFKTENIGEGE